jgi:predicted RNA-binding Zn-ribbon protein involved in translation (DUF1610 family)
MTRCLHCKAPLQFSTSNGWRHPEGGAYVLRCRKCGTEGANVVDDHCVTPVQE